ncbi:MAG: peptide ABC transporter substrate-binding protein, partial [Chloroflexi bacterium]|nr:peptide ABC transporter substrate-binding protein [Chloroflexota bacterium]
FTALIFCTLTACNPRNPSTPIGENSANLPSANAEEPPTTGPPTPTPVPPRVLTICMGQEPASLFLYGDTSPAARGVLQAVYDGPYDMMNYEMQPVILAKIPSLTNNDVYLQPAQVKAGELIVDADGNWVSLQEGASYRPSGCADTSCAEIFEGGESVSMDELVVHFQFLPGIQWSDGAPLTATDSVYSFSVFKNLFLEAASDALRFTQSYTALDDLTIEWVGIPGYQGEYLTKFFSPLPEHLWSLLPVSDLLSSEMSTRTPLGWGPYMIEEWAAGDHITLRRNPTYYRAPEGLPHFDYLVYRFVDNSTDAIDALVVGECDFVDRTALLESQVPRLRAEQEAGHLSFAVQIGTAWEQAAFGINSLDSQRPNLFGLKEVRQAIAMCIDRQALVDTLLFGESPIPDTYVPPMHPLYNPDAAQYEFDPEAAVALLASVGWVDYDLDPATPLTAVGVAGVPDGTAFEFTYLAPTDAERPAAAQIVQASLSQCGIRVEIVLREWAALLGSGPEGTVFGRQFDMAQFAWAASFEPSCFLYSSAEIPGPYPDFPKGWGGGNLAGYSSPEFDQYCRQAMFSLPGSEEYRSAHYQAQAIFADDLPVLPLYQRIKLVAMRPDICGVVVDSDSSSALSHLETFDYGDTCKR